MFDIWNSCTKQRTGTVLNSQDFVHQTLGSLFNLFTVWVNHAIMLLRTPWEKRRKPDMVFSKPGRCIICSAIPHTLRDIGNLEGISSIGWEMHQTLRACIGHLERNAKYSVKCFPKTLRDPLHTLRDISNLKIIPKNIQRFTPYLERLPPYTPWEIIYLIFRKIHPMPSDNYHIYALCRRFSKPWVRQRR